MNKQPDKDAMDQMLAKVKELYNQTGIGAVIEYIEGQGDLAQIVNSYNNLINNLYWNDKSLQIARPVADAGIKFCLAKSEELSRENAELSTKLKAVAKTISFNLASFTWPGWDEKGITVTDADLSAGLDAARLNLKLVEELGADPAQMSASHWSIGAHHLARNTADDYREAIESFTTAKQYDIQAGRKDSKLMNEGYIAMAKILDGEDARADFDAARRALAELGTDDAKFYAEQLGSVLEVFTRSDES